MKILEDLDTMLFTPSVSGSNLLLNVSRTGALPTNVAVGDPEDVRDDVSATGITTVDIKVLDSGGYKMYVIHPAGNQWPRDPGDTFTIENKPVPATSGSPDNEYTVTIEARKTGAATVSRSQKLIIRRIPPT